MYLEAKKLHLIAEVIKIKNEAVLTELETVVNKTHKNKSSNKNSARDFLGMLSEKDASLMDAAINEGCEQINPDDWK
jgi:hypothetical protein